MACFLRAKYRWVYPLAVVLAVPTVGVAANLTFNTASLSFGSVVLTEAKSLKATFKNNSALSVNVTGVTIGGTNPAEFSQTNNCPKPLAAGASCVFTVTFKPAALTLRTATLNLTTDDPAALSVILPLKGNPYPGVLNDTGITTCSNVNQNGLPCPVTGFPRQDAEYGRDKTKNNNADGHAGFSFTKLDANGKALPASATSWNCVRDNVTGLVWEKKPKGDGKVGNQGLHDADDTYTWYSTDSTNNGGFVGYPDSQGNTCQGYNSTKPTTFCNTEAYRKRVNAAGWCGFKDWRVPSVVELRGLVDQSVAYPGPTIATGYFPDEQGSWHWSSSPYANLADLAWIVGFDYGNSGSDYRSYYSAVRLVRGGQ